MMDDDALTFSFVIPVRDDAARLAKCLDSIKKNDCPGARLEIIVVDNGSRDDSAAVARRSGAAVLELPGLSVAALRNRGTQVASGDILAFVDADHELDSAWVTAAVEVLKGTGAAAAGAPYQAPSPGTWVQSAYDALRTRGPGTREVDWLGSGNLAIRRAAFEQLGGFDTSLETCEDVDLCFRLRARGERIVSDERLRSVHFGDPATLRQLFLAELWRGRDNLRVSFRGTVSMRDLPSVMIPVVDLVCIAGIAAGVLSFHRLGLWLSALSVAIVLALAGARTAKMFVASRDQARPGVGSLFVVALVYDLARALALIARRRHHRA